VLGRAQDGGGRPGLAHDAILQDQHLVGHGRYNAQVVGDEQQAQPQVTPQLGELRERYEKLTPRERQVFSLVVSGMINKEAAWELGISEKTIKVHRARVVEKMGARSLPDLVRMAGRLGIPADATPSAAEAATASD